VCTGRKLEDTDRSPEYALPDSSGMLAKGQK
jgi:hypothetical protein